VMACVVIDSKREWERIHGGYYVRYAVRQRKKKTE
jgi:hypothetical protein